MLEPTGIQGNSSSSEEARAKAHREGTSQQPGRPVANGKVAPFLPGDFLPRPLPRYLAGGGRRLGSGHLSLGPLSFQLFHTGPAVGSCGQDAARARGAADDRQGPRVHRAPLSPAAGPRELLEGLRAVGGATGVCAHAEAQSPLGRAGPCAVPLHARPLGSRALLSTELEHTPGSWSHPAV